jgi:alpha-L-fucosidase
VGPKPDGELPVEQEDRLREVALWMWVNGEGIYGVRPWVITNEQDYWFTKKKGEDTLYVFVKQNEPWKFAEWKDITLHSVQATDATQASILSQNDKVAEYRPGVVPKTTWKQDAGGLHVRAMRAQRLYTNYRWPNPVVIKLTHVKPALVPPRVETVRVRWNSAGRTAVFEGRLIDLGKSAALDVGFEYRSITGQDTHERTAAWKPAGMTRLTAPGGYTIELKNLKPGERYEYRAVVKHPLLSLYGGDKNFEAK